MPSVKRAFKTPFNGDARKADGVSITFREQQTGNLRTITRRGCAIREAVRSLCADVDLWEGDWKVQCISTPTTIWRDLQGIREYQPVQDGNFGSDTGAPAAAATSPEAVMLSMAGSMDMYVQSKALQDKAGKTYTVRRAR